MSSLPVFAASIAFTASDLADDTVGQNLHARKGSPSPPPLVNGDWDLLTLQPDRALGSDGRYDALALRNNPSLANLFTGTSVWLGSGSPDAQTFIVYDTDFSTISQGQTTSVPEPGTVALLLVSLAIAMCYRRRKTRSGDLQSPIQNTYPSFPRTTTTSLLPLPGDCKSPLLVKSSH